MEYIVMILVILLDLYTLSYAKYNWTKGNRVGAVGVILLVALSIVGPLLFFVLT